MPHRPFLWWYLSARQALSKAYFGGAHLAPAQPPQANVVIKPHYHFVCHPTGTVSLSATPHHASSRAASSIRWDAFSNVVSTLARGFTNIGDTPYLVQSTSTRSNLGRVISGSVHPQAPTHPKGERLTTSSSAMGNTQSKKPALLGLFPRFGFITSQPHSRCLLPPHLLCSVVK